MNKLILAVVLMLSMSANADDMNKATKNQRGAIMTLAFSVGAIAAGPIGAIAAIITSEVLINYDDKRVDEHNDWNKSEGASGE